MSIVGYVSIGLVALLVLFVLVSAVKSLSKRFGRNISNLIVAILSVVVVFIVMPIILKNAFKIEAIQSFVNDTITKTEIISGASIATVESLAQVVIAAVITPILFIITLIVFKIIALILTKCIKPLNKSCSKNVDGVIVKTKVSLKLLGLIIGIVVGATCFFAIFSPILSVANKVVEVCNSIPEEVFEDKQQTTAEIDDKVTTFASSFGVVTYDNNNATSSNDSNVLNDILDILKKVKDVAKEADNQIIFEIYDVGVDKLAESYLNSIGKVPYKYAEETYDTRPFTELTDSIKGVVKVASYYILVSNGNENADEIIPNKELEGAMLSIISDNSLLDLVEKAGDIAVDFLSETLGLEEMDTAQLKDSIKFSDIAKMNDEDKAKESKAITGFVKTVVNSIDIVEKGGDNVLDYLDTFGSILDSAKETESVGELTGTLIKAFKNSNETIQKYLGEDLINDLIEKVDTEEDTSYTKFLMNIKASLDIAISFAGDSIVGGEEKTEDQLKDDLKKDFDLIYDNGSQSIIDIMKRIIENAVDEIKVDKEYEDLKNVIINEYFDIMYEYTKKATKEEFVKEAEYLSSLIDIVKVVINDINVLTKDDLKNFTDCILDSVLLYNTVKNINDSAEYTSAKEQLASLLQDDQINDVKNDLITRLDNPEITEQAELSIRLVASVFGINLDD